MNDGSGGRHSYPPVHDPDLPQSREKEPDREPVPESKNSSHAGALPAFGNAIQGVEQAATPLVSDCVFRSLVENSQDIFTVASSDGRFQYINPVVGQILGYKPAELVGQPVLNFTHPDDVQLVEAAIERALTHPSQPESVEHRFRHKDGSWRYLHSQGFSDREQGGVLRLMVTSRDITEQKASQAILSENRHWLAVALDAAGQAPWQMDLSTGTVSASDRMFEMYGVSDPPTKTTRAYWRAFILEEDQRRVWQNIDRAIEEKGEYNVEYRIRRASDGAVRWIASQGRLHSDADGQCRRLIGVLADITERKRAEEALRESEQRYRRTFEQAGLGIAHISLEGQYLRVNPALCEMLGYDETELLNKTWRDVTAPEDLEAEEETLLRVLRNGSQPFLNEKRYVTKDGQRVWAAVTTSLLRDDTRSPLHFIRVVENVDWRKQAEAELRRSSRRFSLLAWTSHQLLVDGDPERALHQLGDRAMRELNCDFFLSFISREGHLQLSAHAGIEDRKANAIKGLECGQAICGEVARSGRRIIVEAVQTSPDPRIKPLRPWGVRAYACHPLTFQDRVLGTVSFGTMSRDSFSSDEQAMMESFANQVAIAMGRRLLEQQLIEMHRKEYEHASELERRVSERTKELNRANAEIEDRRRMLESLARELTGAEHRERRRLAEVLHDGVQQLLVGARFSLGALGSKLGKNKEKQEIDRVCDIVQEAIEASRSLTYDLCPPILSTAGLASAFEWLAEQMLEKHGLGVELDILQDVEPTNESAKMVLFSSVRELLFNTVKHSGAKQARLETRLHGESILVRVSDAGIGFEPSEVFSNPARPGFGLFSIRERVALFGGRLEVESVPGGGAEFTLIIPGTTV